MTYLEAAIQTLTENNNKPMTASEIWSDIASKSLVQTEGKTPAASLHRTVLYYSDNSNAERHGKIRYFTIVENNPAKFILINFENSVDDDTVEDDSCPLYECVIDDKYILEVYNKDGNLTYKKVLNEKGYTYFILNPSVSRVKIGKETTYGERLRAIHTSVPEATALLRIPGRENETKYQKEFDDLNFDREWYFYGKGLRNFIDNELKKRDNALTCFELYTKSIEKEVEFLKHF